MNGSFIFEIFVLHLNTYKLCLIKSRIETAYLNISITYLNTTLKLKGTLCKIASQLKVKAGWNIYLIRIETGQHVSNTITFSSLREYYKCQAIAPHNSRRSVFLISDEREMLMDFPACEG